LEPLRGSRQYQKHTAKSEGEEAEAEVERSPNKTMEAIRPETSVGGKECPVRVFGDDAGSFEKRS
jgi:hypothetical protein